MAKFLKIIFIFRARLGQIINIFLRKFGVRIIKISANPQYDDVARTFSDPPTIIPNFHLRPGIPKLVAEAPTVFTVDNGSATVEEEVFYSHLTLLKLLKHYEFETVLDIGSHAQHVTNIFRHLGKKVTTVEVTPGWEADYKADYLDISFPEKFDAIWCSNVLEHQRNVGQFLDKMFEDLRDGGVLAMTNPYNLDTKLTFGHCNCFSPLVLLYHLVLAGFDCSEAAVKCYNYFIGIIIKKKYNGIPRRTSFAMEPNTPDKQEQVIIDGKRMTTKEIMENVIFDNMAAAFPFPITSSHIDWNNESINWGDPI